MTVTAHAGVQPPETAHENEVASIVAKQDGVIKSIEALRGASMVAAGDAVHKGDVLVNLLVSRNTSIGHNILFQEPIAQRIAMDANAGLVIGIIILTLIPYSVHPSILPASRSSFGRLCMYCLKKKIVDAPHSPGRITPALVLMIPRDVTSLYRGSIRISKGTHIVAITRKNKNP